MMPNRIQNSIVIISDFLICVSSYMVAGSVFHNLLDITINYLASFLSLASIAIFVFYIKKWLSKEDERINKNGGLLDFIKVVLRKRFKDNCK
jgi:hypothetical protein